MSKVNTAGNDLSEWTIAKFDECGHVQKPKHGCLLCRIAELEAKNAALSRVATEGLRNQERITDELKARAETAEAALEWVRGLPKELAMRLLAVWSDPNSPAHRIQFMGGEYPDNERAQGGMNYTALKRWFTNQLAVALKENE